MKADLAELEHLIRDAWERSDYARAAELVFEGYGEEILSFLVARLRNASDATEVFSSFSEDFWIGLPTFQWRCSMRAWAYTLARNAANRHATSPRNRADRRVTLSEQRHLSALVENVRSQTLQHRKSEVKNRMRELRERLPIDDQTLLILRVDRNLPWRELAVVLHGCDDPFPNDAQIDRLAARLRQRFQAVKDRLRKLAMAEGLLPPDA